MRGLSALPPRAANEQPRVALTSARKHVNAFGARSVMRRNIVARVAPLDGRRRFLQLPVEMAQLLLQQINLPLLSIDSQIERFHQILGKSDPDFKLGNAVFQNSLLPVHEIANASVTAGSALALAAAALGSGNCRWRIR